MKIQLIRTKISADQLLKSCDAWFGDMVKVVVDVDKEIVGIGGELHADAEALMLDQGSVQKNLWGANVYPFLESGERIQFTALINIRPHQDNPDMEVRDESVRLKMKEVIEKLVMDPNENLV